jgi:nucleotide-binding universal stress UspA family protein
MRVQLKKIVCTTDFSDSSNMAVDYAIALAKEFRAKLYLSHVIDLPSVGMYGDAFSYPVGQQDRIVEYSRGYLQKLVGDTPVDWEPLIQMGHAAAEITRLAKEKCVDMVISGTHSRSGLKRFLLGSITGSLLRTLPCPLLVVRGPELGFVSPDKRELRLRRILIGCDFSSDSHLALQYGLSLAQEFQSELYLAHVIEPPVYEDIIKRSIESEEEFQQDLRVRLNDKLKSVVPDEAKNWCDPVTTLLAGQPHEELIKYAVVHSINLIVMGFRGHGLVETLLVGSTADRVVHRAACPVLLVRPTVQVS